MTNEAVLVGRCTNSTPYSVLHNIIARYGIGEATSSWGHPPPLVSVEPCRVLTNIRTSQPC